METKSSSTPVPFASRLQTVLTRLSSASKRVAGHVRVKRNEPPDLPRAVVSTELPLQDTEQVSAPYTLGASPVPEDFFLLDRLGEGGRGVVHRAVDKDSRVWAVKIVNKHEVSKESVQRELDMLYILRGALNVVYHHDTYEDETNVYIVMEHVPNGHVSARSEYEASRIIRSICRVLKRLHRKDVIHRDVKPSNFLVDDAGHVKAVDFGSAVLSEDVHGMEGTPLFMAPESLNGYPECVSDMWSVGVTAYFLVSGDFPFRDSRPLHRQRLIHVMKSVFDDPLRMDGPVWDDVSKTAKDFIRRCLDRNVETRMTSLESLDHAWLNTTSYRRSVPYGADLVKRLQRWSTFDRKKQTCLQMIANQMVDAKETLSVPGVTERMKDAGYTCSDGDIQTLVHTIGNGHSIDVSTFTAAQLDPTDVSVRRAAYRVFDHYSKDGTYMETCHGTIHRDDLERMFDSNTSLNALSSRASLDT